MKIETEKEKFSARLHIALNIAFPKGLKTSQIATKFNLQHPNEPVTQQAVHKWLNGLAIPSADKIETLALWLNVKPEWLRYGIEENERQRSALDDILISLIRGLSDQQKTSLIGLISAFNHRKID